LSLDSNQYITIDLHYYFFSLFSNMSKTLN